MKLEVLPEPASGVLRVSQGQLRGCPNVRGVPQVRGVPIGRGGCGQLTGSSRFVNGPAWVGPPYTQISLATNFAPAWVGPNYTQISTPTSFSSKSSAKGREGNCSGLNVLLLHLIYFDFTVV